MTSFEDAWEEADAALSALPGGSPYLQVTCDLMAWCNARATNSQGSWDRDGDTAVLALRNLTEELRKAALAPEVVP